MHPTTRLGADPPPHGLRTGEILGGRFRILQFIGAGGMGEVYAAEDQELGGKIALKTIRADRLSRDAGFLDRFRQEARLARLVTHTNVCRVFDVGRDAGGDGDRIFITMEFIEGETLSALLRRQGRIPPDRALPLARQMAAGLDALHQQGIVHRDFKTSNVLISETTGGARAVVTDFGLAHHQDETVTFAAPGVAQFAGTPDYMSPEQLMGKTLTSASDIYAMGLVLYEMLTGQKAFPGGRAVENAVQRLTSSPPPPSRHSAGIPRAWDAVILQCLASDPAARPATAAQTIAALSGETSRAAPPSRGRTWMLAPAAAALLLAAYFAPWGRIVKPADAANSAPPPASSRTLYFQGKDALDHYYRPHAVENAIPLLNAARQKDPRFAMAYEELARANFLQFWQLRDGKYLQPARVNAETALQLNPNLASVHVTLGRIYTEMGKDDLATQELEQAQSLNPNDADAYYALAILYDKEQRTGDVVPNYQKAMDLAPGEWSYPNSLADFYLRNGSPGKALEMYQRAAALTPDNPRALTNLGRAYRRLGRLDDARESIEKAIRIQPDTIAYNNLGGVLLDQGKPMEAAAAYRKALDLAPGLYVVWGNLGFILRTVPGQENAAKQAFLEGIRRAEELRATKPRDTELLSILGQFYAFAGDDAHAIPLLNQAAALAPKDTNVLLRAADSNEVLQHRQDALNWIDKALSHGLPLSSIEHDRSLASLRQDSQYLKLATQYQKTTPNGR